jgi:serine protease Do
MTKETEKKQPKLAKEIGSYTVSSTAKKPGKTVSFTMPELKRPQLRRPERLRSRLAAAGAVFLLAVLLSGFTGAWLQNQFNQNSIISGNLSNQKKIVTSQSRLISQIAKTVGPSVVSVNVAVTNQSSTAESLFYGYPQQGTESYGAGTGIILSKSGLILTNRHVVPEGTTEVSVTLSDGTELKKVSVVGRTNASDTLDVAFLKIDDTEGKKLTPASIGNSSSVQVGDDVVAIGNALGQFQNTVTSGIISGYGRSVQAGDSSGQSAESLDNLFQTDAAINEGNSGGPLVNLNGQVIGINTAVAGDGAQNIGFAIPINDVRGLINQVVKKGSFARPYLGVRYVPLTADIAKEYNLATTNGAFIAPAQEGGRASIIAGSPASKVDLKEGDVITHVAGKKIDQTHSLISLLGQYEPGKKVELTILRDKDTRKVSVTLGTQPPN